MNDAIVMYCLEAGGVLLSAVIMGFHFAIKRPTSKKKFPSLMYACFGISAFMVYAGTIMEVSLKGTGGLDPFSFAILSFIAVPGMVAMATLVFYALFVGFHKLTVMYDKFVNE